jgi:hypothetical protein
MDAKMTFDQLLATAGNGDLEKLRAKRAALESEKARLQEKLTKVNRDLWDIDAQISSPVRNAIKAAGILGIEVPEAYKNVKANGSGEGKRAQGKFAWESNGMVPFQAEASRAMWRLSAGSGGSAGKNGEGVLTTDEFWKLAGCDASAVKLGEKHTVTFPNGKVVTYQKIEE